MASNARLKNTHKMDFPLIIHRLTRFLASCFIRSHIFVPILLPNSKPIYFAQFYRIYCTRAIRVFFCVRVSVSVHFTLFHPHTHFVHLHSCCFHISFCDCGNGIPLHIEFHLHAKAPIKHRHGVRTHLSVLQMHRINMSTKNSTAVVNEFKLFFHRSFWYIRVIFLFYAFFIRFVSISFALCVLFFSSFIPIFLSPPCFNL